MAHSVDDDINMQPGDTSAAAVQQQTGSALDFNLSVATFCWLTEIGALPSSVQHFHQHQTLQNKDAHSHMLWLPLIPTTDLKTLAGAVPRQLLPRELADMATTTPSRMKVLSTIARLSLEPSLTLSVTRRFRPLAPHFWGTWLDMLGFADGEWKRDGGDDGAEREGERAAVEKVYFALIRVLPAFDNVFPFLTTLLRHPLLTTAPLPPVDSTAAAQSAPLIALHSLLYILPHLPSSTHTQTSTRLPWSLPLTVEGLMKRHPHRGVRCIAWRIYRAWYKFYGSTGEDLREKWVQPPPSQDNLEFAPMPDYAPHEREDFEAHFGAFEGLRDEEDVLQGWEESPAGEARLVEGGVELLVKRRGVDPWILPVMEELRGKEERKALYEQEVVPEGLLSQEQLATAGVSGLGRLQHDDLSSSVVDVEGLLLFREGYLPSVTVPSTTRSTLAKEKAGPKPESFIRTPSNVALLRTLALHVQKRLPALITSPPSSGKTSTITHLWQLMHAEPGSTSITTAQARQRGLVVINLADRSLDSKSLLGSLSSAPTTSASEAGSFTFVEGPLTRALRQGRWVVLAQIEQASTEILTVIKIVVERMRRAAEDEAHAGGAYGGGAREEHGGVGVRVGGGDGRWVPAGKGFMLFATRSTDSVLEPTFFSSGFWSEVRLPRLEGSEVATIVEGRYERLEKAGLAKTLIAAWEAAREVKVKEGVHAGTVRPLGVRDLMRWCRRVEGLIPRDVATINSIESNPVLQEEIFTEARDVFLGSMPVPASLNLSPESTPRDRYSVIARLLASALSLSPERAEFVLRRRVPSFVEPNIDETDGIISTREHFVKIGRVSLPYRQARRSRKAAESRTYAHTNPSLIVLEKLAVCLRLSEPVLMVGETGTGKTAAVGHLADKMGKKLTALNLSNQTEAGDLVGGFRPIDEVEEARRTAAQLVNRFVDAFGQTFSLTRNAEFVSHVRKAYEKKRWTRLVGLWREAIRMASDRIDAVETSTTGVDTPRKRRKVEPARNADQNLSSLWRDFTEAVGDFDLRHVQKAGKSKFVFSFVEGPLAKAIRDGDWVLLDEVNLASAETLESLSSLLQAPDSSLVLTEQGDLEPIPRHPEFRLFACMNPATDVGKRDLPAGLRAKFSEIWVPPPDEDREALVKIVEGYIGRQATSDLPVIGHVADLYSAVKQLAINAQLADGANQPPHFSMRTLSRALTFAAEHALGFGHLRRALYEGFLMSFTMLLDPKSQDVVTALIHKHIVEPARNAKSLLKQRVKRLDPNAPAIFIDPYWLKTGDQTVEEPRDYILTPSVQRKVCDLARAVLTRKVPVLIQGPTSAGKTSVVEYLAKRTGHRFVRINNHEHTDIQEYIGTYVSDPDSGKLVFQEGVLVRALRRGDWIVLDELNLAPTDVLEALNRLLDDNRELLIPETGEVVRPHPHFMLFATQNPPGLYGGRKVLSRAFRNRFLEMHFGDVPKDELETILCERCQIAPSYAKKTVAVFVELQRRRQAGRVFEQKQAFATLRDLFRWGGRGAVGYQQLAEDGYMLLAERARRQDDKAVVKEVIEKEMKVVIDEATLYDFDRLEVIGLPDPRPRPGPPNGDMHMNGESMSAADSDLVWTSAMRRLYFLIAAGLKRNEPVLLVGETGSGKTSVCQALASALNTRLHIVGCHQNTETADLLGGQRPLRNRAALQSALRQRAAVLLQAARQPTPAAEDDFDEVLATVDAYLKVAPESDQAEVRDLAEQMRKTTALFEWHDGPLVQAMHSGALILLDEISLADDSVLERLNSVLEPSRTLVLAEKGGRDLADIQVIAEDGFKILATMNPGGDFGKKELSPALRNRFTEIWVPGVDDLHDLSLIIGSRWHADACTALASLGPKILDFAQWFGTAVGTSEKLGIGLRDILGWIDFLNKASAITSSAANAGMSETATAPLHASLALPDAFAQGALMTVVDGLGALPLTAGLSKDRLEKLKYSCWRYLETLVQTTMPPENVGLDVCDTATTFSVGPFAVAKGSMPSTSVEFTLLAPTTRLNAMRLLRALQLKKPVLLEGSPGVGKTSLVTALAAATGHNLVRINLSDQTDLMDLLGSDLPVEGGKNGEFAWKDAPFLAAMQAGDWVLLDEMNLASQSILEGLNSCLDHRGAVFIPELDRTFTRHENFRIFAAQNPLGQGGGRKGLPRSFLDRFSIVHMEELNSLDLNAIARALYPDVDHAVLDKMIDFNSTIHHQTTTSRSFGLEGSPWEFNLRDVLRWLSLMRTSTGFDTRPGEAIEYVGLLYIQRFRTRKDRLHVARVFAEFFSETVDALEQPWPALAPRTVQVGHSLITRPDDSIINRQIIAAHMPQRVLREFEALLKCLDMGWLAILTGPRGSGKTSLVRQIAGLRGRHLREFSMSAEVDTLELLGSFEQAERTREIDAIVIDALQIVEEQILKQALDTAIANTHVPLAALRHLRDQISSNASSVDLDQAAETIRGALSTIQLENGATELISRLEATVSSASSSARFEWVDGPLIRAMKRGDWLLLEDANLCSPSVLDRLNSLFETGGRLQLAERGPVNGEIQIISPHPDFRLVMTLDPRNGELSRAMRNRGIEIALLDTDTPSATSSRATALENTGNCRAILSSASVVHECKSMDGSGALAVAPRNLLESTFEPVTIVSGDATEDFNSTATAHHLLASSSRAHHGIILRLLRSTHMQHSATLSSSIRAFTRHSMVEDIDAGYRNEAVALAVPSQTFLSRPIDLSLTPRRPQDASVVSAHSRAVDAISSLLLSPLAQPGLVKNVAAKSLRALDVWEKSLLVNGGRLKLEDADDALLSLYSVTSSLCEAVSNLSSAVVAKREPCAESELVAHLTSRLCALALELRHVSSGTDFDFSSTQHVAAWIADVLDRLPESTTVHVAEARSSLAPLRSCLVLTSGKAMSEIWRACLPFQPSHTGVAQAYGALLECASARTAETWDRGLLDLFLEVVGALGTPQRQRDARFELEAPRLVSSLLARVPPPSDAKDAGQEAVTAANIASFAVAELAAVAAASADGPSSLATTTLVNVASRSAVVPISSIVPLHQLISWPTDLSGGNGASRSSVEFKTTATWCEHLALGLSDSSGHSPSKVVQPTQLQAVVSLRAVDKSTLGNLVVLADAQQRAAAVQAWTAAADTTSRVSSLAKILASSLALVIRSCQDVENRDEAISTAALLRSVARRELALPQHAQDAIDELLLSTLTSLTAGPEPTLSSTGTGWVAFARCLFHLYLPNLPLDPAVGLRAQFGFSSRQLANLSKLLAVTQAAESQLTGNSGNAKTERLEQEIAALREELNEAGEAPVVREGNASLLAALFQELRAFREQIIGDSQLESLVDAMRSAPTPELINRELSLQRSIETLLRRLDLAYSELVDVLAPVRLALCSLKMGFALLLQACRLDASSSSTRPFNELIGHLVAFPKVAHTPFVITADLPASIKAGEALLPPARATLLQVTALSDRLANHVTFDRDALHRLTQLYDRLHYLWSLDRRHEEEAAQEAASLYKAKTTIQDIASDEEREAAEFAQMFPTFDQDQVADDARGPPLGDVKSADAHSSTSTLLQRADQIALARIHVGLFVGRDASFTTYCADSLASLRNSSIISLMPKMYEGLDDAIDRSSAVYRIKTLVELSQASAPEKDVEEPHHDFYTEPSVRQTARAVPILLGLHSRLSDLINTFPDQMVLHNLRDRCDAVLGLSSQSPIAQVLTALEQLLQHTEDWESFASREHSIVIERNAIIGLIVDWRRFELTCWSRLLTSVQDRFGDTVADWWFRFYETTIRSAPGVDVSLDSESTSKTPTEYYRDLVALMNTFLSESSLGQYGARLELVLAFANFAAELGSDDGMPGAESLCRVARLMLNVYAFYNQYSTRISAFLATERAKVEKDVQNLIKLASWKDVNVYALRQSAVKSHHMLYKAVRKLRAVLQKPASDLFTVTDSEKVPGAQLQHGLFPESSSSPSSLVPAALTSINEPSHLARLDQTFDRFAKLVRGDIDAFLIRDRSTHIDDFATEIITTAKSLRAESVAGEEEGREQRVKSLATRKRRAWIELLRELKRLGLSPSPAPDLVSRLRDPAYIYSIPASRPLLAAGSTLADETTRVQLVKADDYHYRLLSDLSSLYACPAEHNADVSTREIQRAIGSIESGLGIAMEHRTQLMMSLAHHRRLLDTVTRLSNAGDAGHAQPARPSRELADALLEHVSSLLEGLAELRSELANYRSALGVTADTDVAKLLLSLNEAATLLESRQDQLLRIIESMPQGQSQSQTMLATAEEVEVFRIVDDDVSTVTLRITEMDYPPALAFMFAPFVSWLKQLQSPSREPRTTLPTDLAPLKIAHDKLIDSVLVLVQELRKLSTAPDVDRQGEEVPDLTIKLDGRALLQSIALFRFEDLANQVDSFARLSHAGMSTSDSASQSSAASLLQRVAPFLQVLVDVAGRSLASSLEWHKSTLKLNYVLVSVVKELAADGFCRPAEDDGQGGEDSTEGKTSDGTGMADGQGAKNVSKEIEDESQLEGLQGDVEQEQEKKDEPEEGEDDDAVEMSGDFEGQMEDRGDGDKEQDEDGDDDDDDQPEPEEQVADVDPLDPSTVDEKFWGDEEDAQDESKKGANEEINQETTKSAGESEMAAKEEDQAKPQPKGDTTEEQSAEKETEEGKDDAGKKDELERDAEMEGEDENADDQQDEEGEGEQDGEAAHQDDVEQLDTRMPEADNLDLPDDMKLDVDEEKQADDDGLDLDSDMDDVDDDEGENQNKPDEIDEAGETKEDQPSEEPIAGPDDTTLKPDSTEPKQEDEPTLDESLGGAQDGQTGGDGVQDSESSAQQASDAVADVGKKSGTDSADAAPEPKDNDPSAAQDEAAMAEDDDTAEPNPSAPSAAADGKAKQRSSASDPTSDPSRPRPNDNTPAEPQRSLGDTLQSWRRRLEAISDLEADDTPAADLEAQPSNEQGEVEFVQEGDERDEDDQALGPAKEDQVTALEKLRIGEEEVEPTFQPDVMDAEETAPTQPHSAPSTLQLQGSSLTEAEAKAISAAELRADTMAVEKDDEDDYDIIRADEADDAGPSTTAALPPVDSEEDAVVEQAMLAWRNGENSEMNAEDVWRLYESLTRDLSFALTEQLRLILEPTLATRLKGEYRSGKRLNLKKIIPYIASEFTKDKIWLRRTRPSQREYQVLIAIDDSKSMADSHSIHLAFQSLALVSRALTRLEVGGVSISRFGETVDVLHPFDKGGVSDEAGAQVLSKFTFSQRSTDVRLLVERSLADLIKARSVSSSTTASNIWSLALIVSDGLCQDHEALRALLRRAREERVVFVFIVVDSLHRGSAEEGAAAHEQSILSMQSVQYSNGTLTMQRYLDSFPFDMFCLLRDAEALPEVLASTLRQFFTEVSEN